MPDAICLEKLKSTAGISERNLMPELQAEFDMR